MFKENFPTVTAWVTEMTADTEKSDLSYQWVLQQQPVPGQEHQLSGGQVFHHVRG